MTENHEPSLPSGRTLRLAGAVIAGAGLLAYANTFSAPFVFDDANAILDNPSIHDLGTAWLPPANAGSAAGRPLVNFSFALNYALGGDRVAGYHALNLLIHVAAGLVLFDLVRRTLLLPLLRARWAAAAFPVAFFTALLWTVHPLLTESVTCVAQRTESLVGLWYLLVFYGLVRAAVPGPSRRWLAASFAACLLGMLTKEVMVTAPLLAVLFQVRLVDGSWRAMWARRGKFFAGLALTWLPLAALVAHTGNRFGAAGFGLGIAWWEYALTQCQAVVRYLALAFWPHPLVLDYGSPVVTRPGDVGLQALLLAVLLAATATAWFRRWPAAFAGLWFFVILAPSSSVLPLVTQTIAEHRMYLPLAAPIVLTVAGAHALAGPRSVAVFAGLAVVLAGLTVRRNADYATALGLWTDTVAKAPANARAHTNLGNLLDEADRTDEARREYERALELRPDYAAAHYNLANLLVRQDRPQEAIEHFRASLHLDPGDAGAHARLGVLLVQTGRRDEGVAELYAALRLAPDNAAAREALAGLDLPPVPPPQI